MLEYFEWGLPTEVVFGKGVIHKVEKSVKDMGNQCLLLTGKSSATKYGYLEIVTDQLKNIGTEFHHFNNISPNPKTNEITEAANIVRTGKYSYILALGGGSVMDAAKAIAMLGKNSGEIWDYVYKGPGKKYKKFNTALPIVMVPTFAATGSELNSGAVISNPDTKEKTFFAADCLYPKLTLIDPELTYSVSYEATVDGAVDIICHVLEMYLSTNKDDFLQDQLSLAITKSVKRSLDILKDDLKNYEARAQMFWASSLALSGIATQGRSGAFPMHAIEHVLSGRADKLAHGRGLATIFSKMLEFDKDVIPQKIIDLSKFVFAEQIIDVSMAIKKWEEWFKYHKTGGSLKEYIGNENAEQMAEQILKFSGTPDFLPNIKNMFKKDLEIFIKKLA